MHVNIHEIAKRSGFSIATVSRVMNKQRPVKDQTRNKILQIAREMNYRPHPIARSLSRKQTDTIGVILPELVGEFFMDIISGIDEVAHRYNRFILISSSYSQRNVIETSLEFMNSGRVDGVILMAPGLQQEITEIYKVSRRPVVFLNCYPVAENVVSFSINNFQGATSIVEHLIEHGYKKIGMIKGPEDNVDAQDRFKGFKTTLKRNKIEFDSSYLISGDFSIKSGFYGFSRLMSQRDKPEAIFTANDMMAIGAYEAAAHFGLKIPEDIAVVGFDDIFLSRLLIPRLTTVHVPIIELGSKAMQYLLNMIDGTVNRKQAYREELTTGLVIGGSCGCKISHSNDIV